MTRTIVATLRVSPAEICAATKLKTGRSKKKARDMGHLPLSGEDGLLEVFPRDSSCRRILIHINNTNPILDERTPEHRTVVDAGFEIAYDGMEFEL